MMGVDSLNDRFGLAGLRFSETADGMSIAEVDTPLCVARIALQGAQVLAWTPQGEQPVIWLSDEAVFKPGKSLRGGIPVCWPWFGAQPAQPSLPAHGFARNLSWQVQATEQLADGRVMLRLRLDNTAIDRKLWSYQSELELHMCFGTTLELELITRNTGEQAFIISEALHTYFAVGDVRQVRVLGLEDGDYLDKVLGFTRLRQQGPVSFSKEVDRIYINNTAQCVIEDSLFGRRIHIDKRGSLSTVVWNPWQEKAAAMGDMGEDGYLRMLCVETANATPNTVTIDPGEEHRLWAAYRIEH